MDLKDIARRRLASQQIAGVRSSSAQGLVAWMGALQAQDYPMSKWALGVRMPGSTEPQVEAALDRGEVLRTHVLRPTWHIVAAEDIHWMLELTAPHIKAGLRSRHAELGIAREDLAPSQAVIEQALGEKHLVRDELVVELESAGIPTAQNRGYHLILLAELDGLICSGVARGGKPTFALMSERAPQPRSMLREEALAELAKRYFTSHGPATVQDFVWWSGLPAGDARHALVLAKPGLESISVDEQEYWYAELINTPAIEADALYLLPAYDEFIISYKDRRALLALQREARMISSNGIFRPVLVWDGQIIGIWKRSVKKDRVTVEADFFRLPVEKSPDPQDLAEMLHAAASRFGRFLEKGVEEFSNL